jgi:FkbM family methyltransferase
LRPGMAFLDVGANIGYYTAIAARLVGSAGVVHAFEPNNSVRAMLNENIHLNSLTNVVVHAQALSDASGEVTFYESTWNANQGISSMFPGDALTHVTRVASTTLDELVPTFDGRSIDLVKMDIEGAEPLAIEGGRQTFSGPNAPHLIFEAADLGRVEPLVRSLGYQVRRIDYTLAQGLDLLPPESTRRSVFADYEAPNYFAVKDPGVFEQTVARARAQRTPLVRLLGHI